jgi:predicted metal-dependent phosphoesterase TrpH
MSSLPVASRVDLHTHSTTSDGLLAPSQLLRQAHEAGLDLIALTDHDSTDGVFEATETGTQEGVQVIPGVEVNTTLPDRRGEAHVLGYYVDMADTRFQENLRFIREARVRRAEQMVERLRAQGFDVTWERVRELAKGTVGRPHIALALMERGYASSIADAFDKYISPGKPAYVPRYKLSPQDAVRLIRAAGGVPVLAHPGGIAELSEQVLPDLTQIGLLGLECYYGDYDEATVSRLAGVAAQFGLIATGGSDYHGPNVHPTPLGGRYVPPEAVGRLFAAAKELRRMPREPFTVPPLASH